MIYDLHNDYPTALKSDVVSKYVSGLPAGVTATAAIWTSELGSNAYKEVSRLTIALTALKVPIAIEDIGFLSELNRYETFDFSAYAYSSLTWNYNNAFAGGALDDGELTDVGKRAISIIGRSGCALDVAHLNKKSFYTAIDCADKVLCSHTGFNGHLRSLDDGQICALLDKRAIIGLSAVTAFTDAHTCDELQNVIDGFVQEYGAEHLAIGTDFLGSVDLPTDVKDYDGLAKVADGLRKRGYDEKTIYKIFYFNAYSFSIRRNKMKDIYENPLITRYADRKTAEIFSDDYRFKLWRKLWIALAESEKELGLNITDEQIAQMKKFAEDINYDFAIKEEKIVRHDVMAHVHAFGEQAKKAKPIIHLGATSCFVTDNAELIQIYDALNVVREKMLTVMDKLRAFALKYKDLPVLGYTHLQPAQLTTLGKRATLWLYDLYLDYADLKHITDNYKLRGVKGTTGTQASFLSLFDGNGDKVKELQRKVVEKMGFKDVFAVSGQTYTRKFDYSVVSVLSQIAQSAYKFANDMRIMQSFKEVEEPFEKTQIGSSAMAYKRNPMRSERICALARFVESMPFNEAVTSSTQWFERTLDDSANKRLTIPQAFLALDGVLNIYINITENMVVYPNVIARRINDELPFMATEEILMECVKEGGDRQELHEAIRCHSMESARAVKERGERNDLIDRIKADQRFAAVKDKIDGILSPKNFIGRASEQVDDFINEYIDPLFKTEKYVPFEPDIKV